MAGPVQADVKAPNQYHLCGEGIMVTYFPGGFGPVPAGPAAPLCLVYEDAARKLSFRRDEIRATMVEDIGTILSVTLDRSVDLGDTTFSVIVPTVGLPDQLGGSASIEVFGITTVHRTFLAGQAQRETYSVVELRGDAANGSAARMTWVDLQTGGVDDLVIE
jgi:hypothetical protein